MAWRDTWRETVESFLREMRGPEEPRLRPADDPVAAAIAAARAEVASLDADLVSVRARLDGERASAAQCERRAEMARRIGDEETARIAATFQVRHAARVAVLERKRDVLADELRLARAALNELLDLARDVPSSGG